VVILFPWTIDLGGCTRYQCFFLSISVAVGIENLKCVSIGDFSLKVEVGETIMLDKILSNSPLAGTDS
jgi:hypothetical protein